MQFVRGIARRFEHELLKEVREAVGIVLGNEKPGAGNPQLKDCLLFGVPACWGCRMPFAIMQKELLAPSVEHLARAFRSLPSLTALDAQTAANDAHAAPAANQIRRTRLILTMDHLA